MTAGLLNGRNTDELAYDFHYLLSRMLVAACKRIRDYTGLEAAALSGGVFQNKLLTRLVSSSLKESGFKVLLHSLVPPNDGGIAIGQAAFGVKHGNDK